MTQLYLQYLTPILPTILILYYLINSHSSKLFLLGIPFLMYMGNSVMFQYHFSRIFSMPGSVWIESRLFVWLLIVWFVSTNKNILAKNRRYNKKYLGEYLIFVIFILSIIHIMYGLCHPGSIVNVFKNALPILYMTIGYVLLKQLILSYSDKHVHKFFTSIVVITAFTQHLFILHQGLNIKLYQIIEYQVINFMGATFNRTFSIINPLTYFVLGFSLANIETNKKYYYFILIYFVSILFSYTRSAIIVFLTVIVLYIIVSGIKQRLRISKWFKNIILVSILFGSAMLWSQIFPEQSSFFMTRYNEVIETISNTGDLGSISSVTNVAERQSQISEIYDNMNEYQVMFGLGFSEETAGNDKILLTEVWDSEWLAELKYFGVTGMVIFALLQVFYILLGLKLYFTRNDNASKYGLACSLTIAAGLLSTFNMVTFLYRGFAMAFWTFALLQATKNRVISQSSTHACKITTGSVLNLPQVQ